MISNEIRKEPLSLFHIAFDQAIENAIQLSTPFSFTSQTGVRNQFGWQTELAPKTSISFNVQSLNPEIKNSFRLQIEKHAPEILKGLFCDLIAHLEVEAAVLGAIVTECYERNGNCLPIPQTIRRDVIDELYQFFQTKCLKCKLLINFRLLESV